MPRFAANLSFLFREFGFPDRFQQAASAGFGGVEYLFPYDHDAADIAAVLRREHLTQVLFNLPPGDWAGGERGIAALPGRQPEFRASVDIALRYAEHIGCRRLHVMAGNAADGVSPNAMHEAYLENLRYAARRCAGYGITVLIEPINNRDMPGYFLTNLTQAYGIAAALGETNIQIQMDFYHAQIMGGDIWCTFMRCRDRIGHIQIAGVPDRHEPDEGELDYPWLFDQLDASGYDGWIGCEYAPRAGTLDGLGWFEAYSGRGR